MFWPVVKPILRMALRIISIILFITTLFSAYGGRINPEYVGFPAVVTLILPYLAIATMIVVAGWVVAGRFITAGLGALTLIMAWSPISTALPMHFSSKAKNPERTFKLLTYNIVHGWEQQFSDEDVKVNRSFEYVLNSDADIVGLQELYSVDETEIPNFTPALKDSLYKRYPYRAGTGKTDLKVLSRYPVRLIKEYHPEGGGQSRFALYEVKMPWGKLSWINMHMNSYDLTDEEREVIRDMVKGKSKEAKEMRGDIRKKVFASFKERLVHVRQIETVLKDIEGPVIVSGDFNDVPESYSYRVLRGAGLKDAYVETSFGPLITYNRHGFWFHLDQVLYKGGIRPLKFTKGRIKSSDHYPLMVEFEYGEE